MTMVEATPLHKQRIRRALGQHVVRTQQQLVAAGGSWRAVGQMSNSGEIVRVGSTPCAKLVYALTPSERHAQDRCQSLAKVA